MCASIFLLDGFVSFPPSLFFPPSFLPFLGLPSALSLSSFSFVLAFSSVFFLGSAFLVVHFLFLLYFGFISISFFIFLYLFKYSLTPQSYISPFFFCSFSLLILMDLILRTEEHKKCARSRLGNTCHLLQTKLHHPSYQ